MSLIKNGFGPVVIQRARVLDVDIRAYTVSVVTEYTTKPLSGISFATPYQHFANGEGIYFMPEVGSVCWLCEPSDGSMPFVLAWAPAQDEGDFRALKVSLNPGDIYLGTRDENAIILRRGGILQISSTPLCQRIFMPINNTIKDFCENYGMYSLAGDMEWAVTILPESQDGKRPAHFLLKSKEFANDPNPIAELEIGSHGEGADTILSMIVRESGAAGANTQIALSFDKTGNVQWDVEKDVQWDVAGEFNLNVAKDMKLHSDTNATLEGMEQATVSGGLVNVESISGAINLQAATGVAVTCGSGGPALKVGLGTSPTLLATPAVLAWLSAHVHTSAAPGVVTSPPVVPFPAALAQAKDIMSS
jgi:hypothetical protein